jgi:hypothetical protein
MVWHEQVQIIVMTTGMKESGVSLEQYWPPLSGQADQTQLCLAGFCVRLVKQQETETFVCREFLLSFVSTLTHSRMVD